MKPATSSVVSTRLLSVLAVCMLALAMCCLAPQAHADEASDTLYNNLSNRFAKGGADAAIGNNTFIAAPALALAGKSDAIDVDGILTKLDATRKAATEESPLQAGTLAKYVIALTAAGQDCTALKEGDKTTDLIAEMESIMTATESPYSAVIILPAYDYGSYSDAKSPLNRDALIKIILDSQAASGLFGGEYASAQMTAQAILALQPYRSTNPQVAEALDKGCAAMMKLQQKDGGLLYDTSEYSTGTDVSTTGEAGAALLALGIDPAGVNTKEAVNPEGKAPCDALVSLANKDLNKYEGQWDEPMAAAYALAGLTSSKEFNTAGRFLYTPLPADTSWKRLGGPIALDTMSLIVDEGAFSKEGTVVLTTMEGFWDALTASGVAGLANAPILLSPKSELAEQTAAQLKKLAPTKIIVCGGPDAITDATVDAAAAAAGKPTVVRMSGDTALETATDIFAKGPTETGGTWIGKEAFLCTAATFQDALSAAPLSYALHIPIFLTLDATTIKPETIKAMKDGGITTVHIVGGPVAISEDVEKKLKDEGFTVANRFGGDTSVETSELVAQFGLTRGMVADNMAIATNNDYYDALAGGPLCGKLNSVLALVNNPASHSITGFVKDNATVIWDGYIFGGTAAVSEEIEAELVKATKKTA